MLMKTAVLIAIAAVIFFVLAIRSKKKRRPVETVVASQAAPLPATSQLQEEIQELVDSYRREIEGDAMSKACKELGLLVVGKVEEVTRKPAQNDAKRYCQSMKIRLEAFRASYRGELATEHHCTSPQSVDFSNALIDKIMEYLQKRLAEM